MLVLVLVLEEEVEEEGSEGLVAEVVALVVFGGESAELESWKNEGVSLVGFSFWCIFSVFSWGDLGICGWRIGWPLVCNGSPFLDAGWMGKGGQRLRLWWRGCMTGVEAKMTAGREDEKNADHPAYSLMARTRP